MKLRLSTRLIFGVVLIEIVMLSILVWNSVRLISSSHAERMEYQVSQDAGLLANTLAPGLAAADRAVLLDVLSLLHEDAFVYVGVYDSDGNMVTERGKTPESSSLDFNFEEAKSDGVYDSEASINLAGQPLGKVRIGVSLEEIEKLIASTRFQNTSIAFVEIILSITVTLLLVMVVTRHLRKLEAGAAALARGELNHRIEIKSTDEIGDLARGFNDLAKHLSKTQTELKNEHTALERKTQHLQTLIDNVDATIIEADLQYSLIHYVSREAESLLGYPLEDWLESNFLHHRIHPDDFQPLMALIEEHHDRQDSFSHDIRMFRADGSTVWVRSISSVVQQDDRVICRGLLLDISREKENAEHILFLAEHDSLTGLFNRYRFQAELERSLDYAERFEQPAVLMFIDLDQFKYINDTLGHQAGDDYLCLVARRLVEGLRKVDILARLGGDEFGIILPNTEKEQAAIAASHLLKLLAANDKLGGVLGVTASIGIVVFPDDGHSPHDLLKYADVAMYKAKDEGRNNFQYYSSEMTEMAVERVMMEANLRTALKQEEFIVYYQPQFNGNTNELIGMEALVRWQHPTMGLVSPAKFIPLAESTGLIIELDQWVMKTAMTQIIQWYKNGLNPGVLSMNLAMKQLQQKDFISILNQLIKETGCKAQWLELEVTEGHIMTHPEEAIEVLNQISKLGVELAVDDFGTGYSSLAYLKKLPLNKLKIDQSFVRNLPDDNEDAAIAQAVIALAQSLNLKIIAEGVETKEQKEFLINNGCENIQGYFYSKPIPADEMKIYLNKSNIKTAEL